MEKENRVSIWLGIFENRESLDNFISERYTEDGDLESNFMDAFGIDYIDNQFLEVDFYEGSIEKEEIFRLFSYSESFVKSIEDQNWNEYNTIICVYNFEYLADVLSAENVKFIGVYDFLAD